MAGEKTGTGLEPNVAGLLCYVLIWVTGLIFYLIEKENRFVRFHAMQSIIVFGTLTVASLILGVIPIIGWVISWLLGIAALVLWILLMVKAYQNQWFKVPIAGNIAEKHI
ncbi:MAG TPA: DUF4870 domain-containing protein [Dehalococcoidia bacterium]|nr:DUF4870 domain-containing protein [Dehalococcoidia bacterium]